MTSVSSAFVRPETVDPVPLAALAELAGTSTTSPATVTGISMDSRRIRPGDLYVAVPGARVHGAEFSAQALQDGAVAVWTDPAGRDAVPEPAPVLVSADIRGALGPVSSAVYGDPTARLGIVGITGTQGKTTTSYLAEAAVRGAGATPAVIGTIGSSIDGEPLPSALTTPEAPDLHALFGAMLERGADVCAMEVSSHALVQHRVDAVRYDVAVFLNLGRDHLDYHRDLDEYFAAKARLFTPELAARGLVSIDDRYGRELVARSPIAVETMSTEGSAADWMAVNVRPQRLGTRVTVVDPERREHELFVPLVGSFNVANALAAVGSLASLGFEVADLCVGVERSAGVPGRMERVEEGQDFLVVVDYAHKPDAVTAVLQALRPVTAGRLVLVLGAGGDRDRGKRPLMGQIAADGADVLIVTDDNPRDEEPAEIRSELLAGARGGPAELHEVPSRADAIATALASAREGDTVVIAGKGHERGQEIAGTTYPFDDRATAAAWLREHR